VSYRRVRIHSDMVLWRPCSLGEPCSFRPLHILNGLVGQPFASRSDGQRFASRRCALTYNGTGVSW
jgi:hypothetical protein